MLRWCHRGSSFPFVDISLLARGGPRRAYRGWYRIWSRSLSLENLDIIFWAVLAALAFAGELLSVSFFLLFFSLGALVALLMAFAGLGPGVQVAGFIVASVLSMVVLRPALMHRISFRSSERYEIRDSITGKSGVITSSIEPGGSGMVRIGSAA